MKKVIAYIHTHWDREWYREFEVFRLRLLRVFDNVLELLENNKIPSFYFDGQVSALLDYLEIRPEKETLVRQFIKEKKLFIGPCYTLVDEFLTSKTVFEKNLEIGMKLARDFGCTDFIGYLADTFGHSKNIPPIFKKFGIDKCVVWRGCGDFPSEFIFNGINTVNLVRGYFMDIFSAQLTIEQKAEWLRSNLDKIAEKSGDYLLLPIGADHLGVEPNIAEQIEKINKILKKSPLPLGEGAVLNELANDRTAGEGSYEIKLSNPFEYFDLAFRDSSATCHPEALAEGSNTKTNLRMTNLFEWNDELRDNSKTFILQGSYSARTKLKQYNIKCTYLLEQADKLQKKYGSKYDTIIEYAYKLLLKNQAHDGICGCSTDLVHKENITRYEKIIQIANAIIEELRLEHNFKTPIMQSKELIPEYKIISKHFGVENSLLYDTQKIPVTEDFTDIYTLKYSPASTCNIKFEVKNGKIRIGNVEMEFVRYKDEGDTYNFGAVEGDEGEKAKIYSFKNNIIKTSFFDVQVEFGKMINFKIEWDNKLKNRLWQVKFNLKKPVTETFSEDMNSIIRREFDPDWNMREHLPEMRGIEVKTNFAPMQRYVGAQGFGIVTQGLTEYEVRGKSLLVTLLRSTGVISNPKNPSRSTPAGPPIEVPDAQQLGHNCAEFSVAFFEPEQYQEYIDSVFPPYC